VERFFITTFDIKVQHPVDRVPFFGIDKVAADINTGIGVQGCRRLGPAFSRICDISVAQLFASSRSIDQRNHPRPPCFFAECRLAAALSAVDQHHAARASRKQSPRRWPVRLPDAPPVDQRRPYLLILFAIFFSAS